MSGEVVEVDFLAEVATAVPLLEALQAGMEEVGLPWQLHSQTGRLHGVNEVSCSYADFVSNTKL